MAALMNVRVGMLFLLPGRGRVYPDRDVDRLIVLQDAADHGIRGLTQLVQLHGARGSAEHSRQTEFGRVLLLEEDFGAEHEPRRGNGAGRLWPVVIARVRADADVVE